MTGYGFALPKKSKYLAKFNEKMIEFRESGKSCAGQLASLRYERALPCPKSSRASLFADHSSEIYLVLPSRRFRAIAQVLVST